MDNEKKITRHTPYVSRHLGDTDGTHLGAFVLSSGNAVWCGEKLGWRKRLPWHEDVVKFPSEQGAGAVAQTLLGMRSAGHHRTTDTSRTTYYSVEVIQIHLNASTVSLYMMDGPPAPARPGWGTGTRGPSIAIDD